MQNGYLSSTHANLHTIYKNIELHAALAYTYNR